MNFRNVMQAAVPGLAFLLVPSSLVADLTRPPAYIEDLAVILYNSTGGYVGTVGSVFSQNPGSYTVGSCPGPTPPFNISCSSVSFQTLPLAGVMATATGYVNPVDGYMTVSTARGFLNYEYEVVAPGFTAPIQLVLDTYMTINYTPGINNLPNTSIAKTDFFGEDSNINVTRAIADTVHPLVTKKLYQTVIPNKPYQISLDLTLTQIREGSVSGYIDPVISFAPGFDATGYSIVLTPGVGNSPATSTPEPGTFVSLAGAGTILLLLRKLVNKTA
jgi:hypothetical protein